MKTDIHFIISHSFLLRMRNITDYGCGEYLNTHLCSVTFFFRKKRADCELKWKNILKPGRPQITVWRTRIACWIPKATNTHPEYVMLIAFSRHQWLYERVLLLHYTYFARFVVCFSHWLVILILFSHDRSNWSFPSLSSTTFQNFMVFLIYCPKCPSVSITHAANVSLYQVLIHSFFKLDAGWGEWSVSLPGRLIPKQEISITPSSGRRSGTQSRFWHLKEGHISCPCRESSHNSFGVHAVGRSLTD
jgi:hypothetical protein